MMKKRITAFILAFILVASLIPNTHVHAAGKTASEITSQITSTYNTALSKAGRSSFSGYCATYVNWQLVILGINKSYVSGNGNQEYDNYKNLSKSSGGYDIYKYPVANYSLKSALNAISENGTKNVYNVLVGFTSSSTEAGKKYGHTFFIHAILDGVVYFSESSPQTIGGTYYAEGKPIKCSIAQVASYYSNCTLDGVIHFASELDSHTCNQNNFVYNSSDHPHYSCYACSVCGKVTVNTSKPNLVNTCTQCRPSQPVLTVTSNGVCGESTDITFSWADTTNTTQYDLVVEQKDDNGNWERHSYLNDVSSGLVYELNMGEYRASLISYCNDMMEADGSDYVHTTSEKVYFTAGHTVESWTNEWSDCVSFGTATGVCTNCGETVVMEIPEKGHNYKEEIIPATCTEYAINKYTCTDCGDTYEAYTDSVYSEWTETYPENVDPSLIQAKTQYRTSDYESFTSYEADLDGYELLGSEWVQAGTGTLDYVASWPSGFSTSHSLYTKYKKTPVTNSESATNKTSITSTSTLGYLMWHWCRGTYTAGPINRKISDCYTTTYTTFHAFYSANIGSNTDPDGSDGGGTNVRYISNASCCTDAYWYFYVPVTRQNYTTYNKLFTYGDWSDWSEWTDEVQTADDNTQVDTRTVYRYVLPMSEWTETYPEGIDESLIETKTEYRYSDYQTLTSYEPGLADYELLSSEWEQSGTGTLDYASSWPSGFDKTNSLYTKYNKTAVKNSETTTDKTVVNSSSTVGYIMWHWCRGSYTAGPINRAISDTKTSEFSAFHAFYSTGNGAANDPSGSNGGGDMVRYYSNGSCCKDAYWYFYIPVIHQNYTTYKNVFTYARWTEWSEWSAQEYTETETRKVESRTMYRYKTAPSGDHTWDEGVVTTAPTCLAEGVKTYTCTSCGETKTSAVNMLGHSYHAGSCVICGAEDPDYDETPMTVALDTVEAKPGETVTVPVRLINSDGFAGFTLEIVHDDSLTITGITKGALLNSSEGGSFTKNVEGGLVTWFDAYNTEGDGVLFTVQFTVAEDAENKTYPVSVKLKENHASNFVYVDEEGNILNSAITFEEGNIVVDNSITGWSGNTTWKLTSDGTLTVSPEVVEDGACGMKNYGSKTAMPWYEHADQINTVVVENGVTHIGNYAFYGMPNLKNVIISSSVTSIGDYAFKGCEALETAALPVGLTQLGESAFYGCISLKSVDIPDSLWTIKPYTFKNCTGLTKLILHEGSLQKISDGAFYNTGLTKVTFPACLSIIDGYSFKNCSKLAEIIIPEGNLTQIREAAFYGTAISTITIPEGVNVIKPYAFKNCVNLKYVGLPSTLTSIDEAAFYACTALEAVDIPDAVTTIGNYAFRKCAAMTSVAFGSGLTTIGESSFYGCTGLTGLSIPRGVTTIKAYAFKGCTGLKNVNLPTTLTTLGDSAFHTCTGLTEIVIPNKVTSIGEYCFSGSTGITVIEFLGNAPTIGTGAFNKITATVLYPDGNITWNAENMLNYGGTISWKAN